MLSIYWPNFDGWKSIHITVTALFSNNSARVEKHFKRTTQRCSVLHHAEPFLDGLQLLLKDFFWCHSLFIVVFCRQKQEK